MFSIALLSILFCFLNKISGKSAPHIRLNTPTIHTSPVEPCSRLSHHPRISTLALKPELNSRSLPQCQQSLMIQQFWRQEVMWFEIRTVFILFIFEVYSTIKLNKGPYYRLNLILCRCSLLFCLYRASYDITRTKCRISCLYSTCIFNVYFLSHSLYGLTLTNFILAQVISTKDNIWLRGSV